MSISSKVSTRISSQLKRYQGILAQAQQRDLSEANTSLIISDMLADVMGYNKYQHVTAEHSIRGTYVDLAVEIDGELRFLIEVKAIGLELKDAHVKQAIDYGANKGVEWIVLTNGAVWRIYRIVFAQPIDKTLVCEIDLLSANARNNSVVEYFGNLSREGFSKASMSELAQQKQITSKFAIAAVLLSDTMLDQLRRELRRLSPGLKVDVDFLQELLIHEVIKRDLVDSDEAKNARNIIRRLQRSLARERKRNSLPATELEVAESDVIEMTAGAVSPPVLPAGESAI